ncbi:hypothetical protein [Nocardia brasiliensis]|uniref:hypothetical protein n=1 Tax=Nocardia brasiliensis TaxID=37326 RepID=UPI002454D7F7|nr:hypothetical protein [Nocardia brasiliensis]
MTTSENFTEGGSGSTEETHLSQTPDSVEATAGDAAANAAADRTAATAAPPGAAPPPGPRGPP